jgi:E3 ubiquitin-protein ligase TRIP12
LGKLNTILRQVDNPSTTEFCFRVIALYGDSGSSRICRGIELRHFFRCFPLLSRIDQRLCITTLSRMATKHSEALNFGPHFDQILDFLTNEDDAVRRQSAELLLTISDRIDVRFLRFDRLNDLLTSSGEMEIVRAVIQIIYHMCQQPKTHRLVKSQPPDFHRLFSCFDDEKLCHDLLKIIQFLMPTPNLPPMLWISTKVTNKEGIEFTRAVEPIVRRYFVEKCQNETLCLQTIAAAWSLSPIIPRSTFYPPLVRMARDEANIPFLIAMVFYIPDRTLALRSGLIAQLSKAKLSTTVREWGSAQISAIQASCRGLARVFPTHVLHSENIEQIASYCKAEAVYPFEFAESGLLEHSVALIRKLDGVVDLAPIAALANGILAEYQLPQIVLPSDVVSVASRIVRFRVKSPIGDVGECKIPLTSDFSMVEGWYNLNFNKGIFERLRRAIDDNPYLEAMLRGIKLEKSHQKFALYCRAFQVENYKKCSFRLDREVFSVFDNVHYALSRACNRIQKLSQNGFSLEIIEQEGRRSPFVGRPFADSERIFDLAQLLTEKVPDQFPVSPIFQNYVFSQLSNPLQTIMMFAPAAQLIFAYPRLFAPSQRLWLFRTLGLDSGLAQIQQEFWPDVTNYKQYSPVLKCVFNRNTIFEQGCFLIGRFGGGRFRLQIAFEDEEGLGDGPTQEFFTSLAHSFCKRGVKLWRDNSNAESEMVVDDNGLFPAVECDTGLLSVLGYVCGKAVLLHKVLPLPLNRAFIKMILGQGVALEEVDPQLAASLRSPEGLLDLTFVYPGTNVELKPGGKRIQITEDNFSEYRSLIESFTCGSEMIQKVEPFIAAFETNVHVGALSLFSLDEVMTLICGEDLRLSLEDLRAYTKLEHGYDAGSKLIEDFFSVCVEFTAEQQRLFLKFVTGCGRMPFGGLRGLRPALTIARRVLDIGCSADESLPSVMTCTNYLKLPAYSSKEIMRERVLEAITECQDSFELT